MDLSLINNTKSGNRIRDERKRLKKSQIDVANDIGYSCRNELSACENGDKTLEPHHYEKLCELFGVRMEYILGIDDYRTPKEKNKADIEKFKSYHNIVIRLLEYQGYKVTMSKDIAAPPYLQNPTEFEMEEFGSYVLEITKDNKTECLLLNDVYSLLNDFFALIETRKKPHTYMSHAKWKPTTKIL